MKKVNKTFWVTNISNRNVSLTDLNLTIKAMSVVNLLDVRRYQFTEEQLETSITSGSLYLKRDMIKKRLVDPVIDPKTNFIINNTFDTAQTRAALMTNKIKIDANPLIPSRQRSTLEIKIEEYEELKVSEDREEKLKQEFEMATETADTVEYDRSPLLAKK